MPNVSTSKVPANGRGARAEIAVEPYPLPALFNALQAMKNGDFSVRMRSLPSAIAGVAAKTAASNKTAPMPATT